MIPNDNPLVPDYIEVFYQPVRDNLAIQVLLIALCILIVCDLVFGMAAAAKNGEFDSSKVRQGLWHKTGELVLVMLAMVIDALVLAGIELPFDIPQGGAIIVVALGLIVMEISSLMEIAIKLNDQLASLSIFKYLKNAEKYIKAEDDYFIPLEALHELEAEDDGEDQQ